jgi:branched-chain amino acid transport system permease protein
VHELPQQLANGLILGAMYGLIAIGSTMVYGIVQLINFAHGEIYMVGGFGALTVWLILPEGFALGAAVPLMILGGVIVSVAVATAAERFAYRPLRTAPRLAPLITAIGLSIVLQQAVWMWYPDAKKDRPFPQFDGGPIDVLGANFQRGDLFVLIAAPLCMVALGLFVTKTRSGRGMQATAQDPDTAKLMGINTDRIIVMAFAIGAAFAAIAAVAYGLKNGQKFAGETQQGWKAYNITSDPTGIGSWSEETFVKALRTGRPTGPCEDRKSPRLTSSHK